MKPYADIAVFDKFGQIALLVEIKNKRGKSEEWAKQLRRNMYSHGYMPKTQYFLLALPDKFFLWNNADSDIPVSTIDPKPFLDPYYNKTGIPENHSEIGFSFVISSWLNNIIKGELSHTDKNSKWLFNSGLMDKLTGGYITSEAA